VKRTRLILKCRECGKRFVVTTNKPMVCPECGNDKWYCHECKRYFEPRMLCLRCRWFICPYCGSCGCDYVRKVRVKRAHRRTYVIPNNVIELPPEIKPEVYGDIEVEGP